MRTSPLEILQREHIWMACVLKLVRIQLSLLERRAALDRTLLSNNLWYLQRYATAVHHPNERWLFARLRQADSPLEAQTRASALEHQQLELLGARLVALASASGAGSRAVPAEFPELGRAYLRTHFAHMDREENRIYLAAAQCLKARDREYLRARFDKIDRNLPAEHGPGRYQHLYEFLLRTATEQGYGLHLMSEPRQKTYVGFTCKLTAGRAAPQRRRRAGER
ncbi:MAG: hemerythrin domain-containing protein [Gammaproteobacteria bacterium]